MGAIPEVFTDIKDSAIYGLTYRVGEQTGNVSLMPKKGDADLNLAAAEAVAQRIQDHIDADLTGITAKQVYVAGPIRDDSQARISPTRFNFDLLDPVEGSVMPVTIFVPWFLGANQAAKKALGEGLATDLSGPDGTYTFRS